MIKYYGVSKAVKDIKENNMLVLSELTFSDIFDVYGILDAETGRYLCDVGEMEIVIPEEDIPECKRLIWGKADIISTYNALILNSGFFIEDDGQDDIKELLIKMIESKHIGARDIPLSLAHLRPEIDLIDKEGIERIQGVMDILIADTMDIERRLNLLVLNTFSLTQRRIYYMHIKLLNPNVYKLLMKAHAKLKEQDAVE